MGTLATAQAQLVLHMPVKLQKQCTNYTRMLDIGALCAGFLFFLLGCVATALRLNYPVACAWRGYQGDYRKAAIALHAIEGWSVRAPSGSAKNMKGSTGSGSAALRKTRATYAALCVVSDCSWRTTLILIVLKMAANTTASESDHVVRIVPASK